MPEVYAIVNGQLMHAEKKDHKYIAKVKLKNGKYRYFYDRDEYEAYLNPKNKKSSKSGIFAKIKKLYKKTLKESSDAIKKGKKIVKKYFKKTLKESSDAVKKGKKTIKKLLANLDKKTSTTKKFKYVKRVKLSNGKYRYFYSNEEYERYVTRQKYQNNEPDFMKKTPKIPEDKSLLAGEDMAEVNEDYSPYEDERSKNCVYCSAAYELRSRGYDVQAKEFTNELTYKGQDIYMRSFYEDPKMITIDSKGEEHKSVLNGTIAYKKHDYGDGVIDNAILKHSGKNTRGEIRVTWKSGGGHSMVYETNENSVTIRDCQTNTVYKPDQLNELVDQVTITRTDNLKLKKGILKIVEDN